MIVKLVRVIDYEGHARFQFYLSSPDSDTTGHLLRFSQTLCLASGTVVDLGGGIIDPDDRDREIDPVLGMALPELEWSPDFEFSNSIEAVEQKGKARGELALQWFKPNVIWLDKFQFSENAYKPYFFGGRESARGVQILGQQSEFGISNKMTKKLSYRNTKVVFRNMSDDFIYVTYNVSNAENQTSNPISWSISDLICPKEAAELDCQVVPDRDGKMFGLDGISRLNLKETKLFPFIVVYSAVKAENFEVFED